VKAIVKRDDLVLCARGVQDLACFSRKLYGSFVGFRSGIADKDRGGIVHSARLEGLLHQQFAERTCPGIMV
jgi:hypothetical protein